MTVNAIPKNDGNSDSCELLWRVFAVLNMMEVMNWKPLWRVCGEVA